MLTLELLSPKPTTTLLNTFLTFLTLTFAKDFDILCIKKNQAPIYPPTYLSAKGPILTHLLSKVLKIKRQGHQVSVIE